MRDICVIEECGEAEYGRGLCQVHYASAHYHIKKGHATWDELVAAGLANPKQNRLGKISSSPFDLRKKNT